MRLSPNDPMARGSRTDVYAVILAGGSGTRFWPLSRETWPKQMLQIVGEDTLIRQTIKRITVLSPENIWIVTTEDKAQDIRFHIEPLGTRQKRLISSRNPWEETQLRPLAWRPSISITISRFDDDRDAF